MTVETFITQVKKMGEECADFWNDIYKNQVRKTDKEARVELIGIGMPLSFYVRGGGGGGGCLNPWGCK